MTGRDIRLDLDRVKRIGFDEAIFCQGKSRAQIERILDHSLDESTAFLLTRLDSDIHEQLDRRYRESMDYDPLSRTAFFNWQRPQQSGALSVAVVAAGTSDSPVATEALRTLTYYGIDGDAFIDVGVAGLWRLLNHIDELNRFPVIICVAGMDGALPSVLGGLVGSVVIAVPTSTGYGASRRGETALHAALASCAPGICVVNIDNGYGAACAALRFVNATLAGRPA